MNINIYLEITLESCQTFENMAMKNKEFSDYELSNDRQNQSSFQNSLCVKKEKKLKLKLRKQRIYKQKQHGSWTQVQEQKFIDFMKPHLDTFQSKNLRRSKKIFRQMSRFIKTRSSEQCRSHHQKYQIRFGGPIQIIEHIEEKIRENAYQIQSQSKQELIDIKKQVIKQKLNNLNKQYQNDKVQKIKKNFKGSKKNQSEQKQKKQNGSTKYSEASLILEQNQLIKISQIQQQSNKTKGMELYIQININQTFIF